LAVLKCWHFNDSKGALGSHLDRHVHIGEGQIGLEGFRLIINDLRWDGIPMLLETPKEDDLKEDLMNLQRLCGLVENSARIPVGLGAPQNEEMPYTMPEDHLPGDQLQGEPVQEESNP